MKRHQSISLISALVLIVAALAATPANAQTGPRPSRLLVIAPHPDDEILAAGGLIHSLVQQGADVKIVFMTAGDGYPLAAMSLSHNIDLKTEDYIALGLHRMRESTAALARLGVGSESIVHLGYPDGGILAILDGGHWYPDESYTSQYTGAVGSPYSFTYTPQAPYCGEQIVQDLKDVASEFAPDLVLIPHPSDTHTDHSATYAFAIYALEQLESVASGDCRVMCYIVHSGLRWPETWAYRPDHSLTPPPGRSQPATVWISVPLSPDDQEAKYGALEQHASQLDLGGWFLNSFVRTNELFATVPGFHLADPAESSLLIPLDGSLVDSPVNDVARLLVPGGEIRATVVSRVLDGVLVTVDLAGRRRDSLDYLLKVAPTLPFAAREPAVSAASIINPLVYTPSDACGRPDQVEFRLSEEDLDSIGRRALFEVVTVRNGRILDRSGWFRVSL